MTGKTGMVAATKLVEHLCRIINKFSTRMLNSISAAEVAGTITSTQASTLVAFIQSANAACAIFKLITGY